MKVFVNLYQSKTNKTTKRTMSVQMATTFTKVTGKISKYELYKIIYNERNVYIEWLDEIKKNGVDNKMRIRNPLRNGGLIYTNKNGLYATLWNLCVVILQGNYDFTGIPRPTKVVYKHTIKFYTKP